MNQKYVIIIKWIPKSNYDKRSYILKKSNKLNNKSDFVSYKNFNIKNGSLNGIYSQHKNNIILKNARNKRFKLYDLTKISDKLKINLYQNDKQKDFNSINLIARKNFF